MPAHSRPEMDGAPISNLDQDLLWHIFWINTITNKGNERFQDAIDHLRRTSQVCSSWRNLVLSSPSLWGRVFNFNKLGNESWRSEVLRRTSASCLFVRGDTLDLIEGLVLSILADNWSRIRLLSINFYSISVEHYADWWILFQQPSEVLEALQIDMDTGSRTDPKFPKDIFPQLLSPPDWIIFDGHAPRLRVFDAPNIQFDLRAPWTTHIRCLVLSAPVSVYALLDALAYMPLLEMLKDCNSRIISDEYSTTVSSLPQVELPRLRKIDMHALFDIQPYMTVLTHIKPAGNCCLVFTSRPGCSGANPITESLSDAANVLRIYSRYAGSSLSTEIHLDVNPHEFKATAEGPVDKLFCFQIKSFPGLTTHTTDNLFTALDLSLFNNIHKLTLHIRGATILPSNPKLSQVIQSNSSLKELSVIPATVPLLLSLPPHISQDGFHVTRNFEILVDICAPFDVAPTRKFLILQRAFGNRISTLAICTHRSRLGSLDTTFDMAALEDITNLRVVITGLRGEEKNYICGSGRPKELFIQGCSR